MIKRLREYFMTDKQWEMKREKQHMKVEAGIARSKKEYEDFLAEVDKGIERSKRRVQQTTDQGQD